MEGPSHPGGRLERWLERCVRERRSTTLVALQVGLAIALLCSAVSALAYWLSDIRFASAGDYAIGFVMPFALPMLIAPPVTRALLQSAAKMHDRTQRLETEISLRRDAEARLEALATVDDLTKVANRRAFFTSAGEIGGDLAPDAPAATVAVLDLDHFKRLNDTYGHAAGDDALRRCGEVMIRTMYGKGTVGRLGGEEFGLVLNAGELDDAVDLLEKLRQRLAEAGSGVTASIGVSDWLWDEPVDAALARADSALYRAKQGGRNRVVVAPRDDPASTYPSERSPVSRR